MSTPTLIFGSQSFQSTSGEIRPAEGSTSGRVVDPCKGVVGDAPWPAGLASSELSASAGTVALLAIADREIAAWFYPDDRDWLIWYTGGGRPLAMAPFDEVGRHAEDGTPVFALTEVRNLDAAAEELGLTLRELFEQLAVIWDDYETERLS
ncbi:MAG TPA: hypothetical protein VFU97_24275 [Xanthobacteraceae bacterium]|nr:hypothetical protein [Xanthobacteraceae bacterium]